MPESNDVQLARQDERLQNIQQMLLEHRADAKEHGDKIAQMFQILSSMENRIKVLEEMAEKNAEMQQEYATLKNEVAGAKKMARALWISISALAAVGLSIKNQLIDWLSR